MIGKNVKPMLNNNSTLKEFVFVSSNRIFLIGIHSENNSNCQQNQSIHIYPLPFLLALIASFSAARGRRRIVLNTKDKMIIYSAYSKQNSILPHVHNLCCAFVFNLFLHVCANEENKNNKNYWNPMLHDLETKTLQKRFADQVYTCL